jgi:GT2 family glycosyltransferase/SAM-dependent methyltransferase
MNQELERFEPTQAGGRIAYEHLHRYAICRDRVAGLRVLDVACGAGYGTNILAQAAAEATGVDIDAAAIRKASKKYKRDNLKFVTADCCEMPFEADSFDVVVANEMIEHIEEQAAFLEEAKRVLKPGGALLVSTPNKPVYNRYKSPNPFHVAEMTIPEFRRLLKRHFGHVQFTGLRMALVSTGFEMDGSQQVANLAAAKTYRGVRLQDVRPDINNDELHFDDPEYLLATCSDRPIQDAPAHATIFFSNEEDLWLEHEKIMAWASQLHEEDEILRANLRDARVELDDVRGAFDEEKRTNGQSSDQARQFLTVSSRLLSRLTGSDLEADPTSLVEAMFALNEQIVIQRTRLERLAETEERVANLQQEVEAGRAQHELRVAALKREHDEAREKLSADLQAARDVHRAQLVELDSARDVHRAQVVELDSARAEQARLADELRRSELRSDELQRHTRQWHEERDNAIREAEHRAISLERALKEAQGAVARLSGENSAGAQDPGEQPSGPRELQGTPSAEKAGTSRQLRRRSRLIASHSQIQDELGRACEAMRGAVPPADPAGESLISRLFGTRSPGRATPFDRLWIERQVPDVGRISVSAFLKGPCFYRVDPHPLFASTYYLERYPDIAAAGMSPLAHYLEHGWREGRDPHPYFANDWYLQQNPDVLSAGINPLMHYLEHGWKEGRRPNPVFDPRAYLAQNPDVEAAGLEPLSHFVAFGLEEDRAIPFLGLERDWRALAANSDAQSLMDYLLSDAVAPAVAPQSFDASDESWPPRALNDFWIPQALRDFMIGRHLDDVIPLYTYFYSIMDAFADAPDQFPDSSACQRIMDRARELSSQRASRAGASPQVSVIVPAYNNILDTLLCIVSLLETQPEIPFEIIVADDCSNDATERLIPAIGGIVRHVRHNKNLGFVGNCNAAAEQASGNKIVLLNNDTLPLPGWLENLVAPFHRLEKIGLVGSKLINWDGRLQEAGGIFWKDGSAWNFGRGENPCDSEYNYLKDVDYCSGASIAIPTELWRRLGGFDSDYGPAYCEDSDLAFRIREAGYRTLYSPFSELIHHEGRSHGRDTATGIKAHQVTNQQRLFDRWQRVLERDHFRNGDKVLRARDRSIRKPHILVIDHYVPQFDKDAGSRTMFHFLEALVEEGWAVTFWPENLYHDPDYTRAIQEIGVEAIYGPRFVGKFSDFLRSRTGLYDAVLLSRPHVAVHFIDDVRALTDARVLYYGHDVHFQRMKAQKEVAGSTIDEHVEAMRALELTLCDRCDVILYPSEDEAQLMAKLVAPNVQSRAIPAYRYSDAEIGGASEQVERISPRVGRPAQLLFVGGFSHGPNADGIAWFSREVAPILRSQGFQFELQIAGSNPTAEVWDLETDDTHVLGFVSDDRLLELYRNASAVIAPLRFGAGVKGKVVEAMVRGVPVATTSAGAQGLSGAENYLFIGDSPEEFAAAVRAATDAEAGRSKARSAVDYVREHYSQTAMVSVFKQVLPSPRFISKAA